MSADIFISADGDIQFIHDDDVAALFADEQTVTRRASHVEPTADGRWTADMAPVGGPVIGPVTRRGDALSAEIEWLTRAFERGSVEVRS